MNEKTDLFGTESIGKLLRKQAIPASVGIMVMSVYSIIDTIFVGRWVGNMGIGAITVVMPITFLISSLGMAIGSGGSSIISRAFGSKNHDIAYSTFGNQVLLTTILSISSVVLGYIYLDEILFLFGAKGEIMPPAREYFKITLLGVPFLAWAMMSNHIIRTEGFPKIAMFTLIIPAIINLILDPLLIIVFDMGMAGAAWATVVSYVFSAVFTTHFFVRGKSKMRLQLVYLKLDFPILKEIISLGSITFVRQGVISVLAILLNHVLFTYGAEEGLNIYGIVNRLMFFALFPVLGITQGTLPIIGYNYGAKNTERVDETIRLSMRAATITASIIFLLILIFAPQIAAIFTKDQHLIQEATPALRWAFLGTPLIAISLIGSGYFQSIGKAKPALLLSLTKQGFFLIPLVLILPYFFGVTGAWISFPIADVGSAIVTYWFFKNHK